MPTSSARFPLHTRPCASGRVLASWMPLNALTNHTARDSPPSASTRPTSSARFPLHTRPCTCAGQGIFSGGDQTKASTRPTSSARFPLQTRPCIRAGQGTFSKGDYAEASTRPTSSALLPLHTRPCACQAGQRLGGGILKHPPWARPPERPALHLVGALSGAPNFPRIALNFHAALPAG